jgi:tight adherence protein B
LIDEVTEMVPLLVSLLAFAALFFAVFAANALLVDLHSSQRRRVKQRLEDDFRIEQRQRARAITSQVDFSRIAAEALAEEKETPALRDRWQFMLEQSRLKLSLAQLLAISVLVALAAGAVVWVALGSALLGLVFAALAFTLPPLYVQFKFKKHRDRLLSQLPDAFELMSRVMRAGQTVSQAMQAVGEEFSPPISAEFLYCYEQMNLGLSADAALRELRRRTGLLEIKIFVLAVLVHRQTGGNLAELLEKLAHVVRERFRIRGMIKSLTAQGRFQAGILLSLPPAMFLLLMFLHSEYEKTLLEYPALIAMGLAMMLAGALWIRKIVTFEF